MEDVLPFQQALASAKNIIVLDGAGLSAASGIPTYRGVGGVWLNFDQTKLANPEAFREDPSKVWQFYHARRQGCLDAQPNAGHRALATFCLPQTLARVAPSLDPKWPVPLHVVQNADALSSRVLDSAPFTPADKAAVQKCIREMHGCLFETRCTSCRHVQRAYTPTPYAAALDAARDSGEVVDIPVDQLPRCGGPDNRSNRQGRCGGLLSPNVVWFGEVPEHLGEIGRQMNWCDLLLLVGTSAKVHPAAGFSKTVKERGGKIAVFNVDPNTIVEADFTFVGPCAETLPLALGV
ncbi:sirtuin [Mycena metata]|uniref:Sirtuin n=1 Tax=Mycena metata TaxID=1033252 RepID=A0AAD7NLZ1_9AGAR|nr:sirtuin [Mycena metata]